MFRVIAAVVSAGSCALQAAEPLTEEATAAMARATDFMRSIATEGGYLWRYSLDLKQRAGESAATASQIWVQAGTPAMGLTFLRAHEVTGDARYLEAAKAAADALATGQLESGGWDYVIEFDPAKTAPWYRRTDIGKIPAAEAAKRRNVSTYDDDNTQSALRLLIAVSAHGKRSDDPRDVRIREARDYGLTKLIEAQRPNGGWPQRWNGARATAAEYPVVRASFPESWPREHPRQNYYEHYTLNDQTQRDCVMTLLDAAKRLGRAEYREAAFKGGDFLLLAQLPEPQPGWAQQYNPQMEPAWARAFEPPAVCSAESAGALRLLVDLFLESGEEKYLEPIPRAIAWLKRSEIGASKWARLYELGTNRPIYGDRDGKIHYRLEELSLERQTGYAWRGDFGVPSAMAYFDELKRLGRDGMLATQKPAASRTAKQNASRARSLDPKVRTALANLDAQGRWLSKYRGADVIRTETFIENMTVLCDYLEAVK